MRILAIGLLSLFAIDSLHALYSGNPDEPELIDNGLLFATDNTFGVKIGYEGDFVFDRRLNASSGASCRVDEFQSRMNQGVLTLNFFDKIEAFGSVGSMNAYVSLRPHKDGERREFQSGDATTWGAGGRVLLFTWDDLHAGVTGSYQSADLPMRWNALNGETFSTAAKMKYWEWQIAGLFSYRVEMFDPYIGITYSVAEAVVRHIRSDMQLGHRQFKMKSRDRVGAALGCSLTPSKIIDLNVEVRLFDEEAISVAGNLKF